MIIANPPYVSIQGLTIAERELYKNIFKFFYHRYDLFGCFIEKGIELLSVEGLLCFIQPSVFLNSKSFMKSRKFIVENTSIINLNLLKDGVFESAVVPTMIMLLRNTIKENNKINCSQGKLDDFYKINQEAFINTEANVFNLELNQVTYNFIQKTGLNCQLLGDIARISRAINVGDYSKYLTNDASKSLDDNFIKVLKGASIKKWFYEYQGYYLKKDFDEFVSCGDLMVLNSPKLMMKRIGKYPDVCYDETGIAGLDTIYTIRVINDYFSIYYILGLLNSKLLGYIFRLRVPLKGDVFPEFRIFDLNKQMPIKIISKDMQQPIITLVNQILEAKQANPQADTSALETQIDQLVYELYGLTQEEIDIIEGN